VLGLEAPSPAICRSWAASRTSSMVDAADRRGILVDWPRHARVGVPVTIATVRDRRRLAVSRR